MAIDPEELKRQRQLRQQQRESQQKQTKKLIIRLSAAAVILLLCGVLIFVLSRPDSPSPDIPVQDDPILEVPTETTEPPPTTTVHLTVAGDLNITDGVVNSGGADMNFAKVFQDVAPVLANGDITLLNLEGSLYGAPYGAESRSAPQSMMEALDNAGVDLIQLANSYAINHGISGLSQTIDRVRAAGMEPLGVWADTASYNASKGYTLRDVNGVKIAFLAFTKGMDGMTLPTGSENCVNVLYEDYDSTYQTVNVEKITKVMKAASKENPDAIVVLLHWGSEFNDTISVSQKRILRLLQELGADAVIGTHSHYVQQMSLNEETGQFVAYSLGDFYGDAQRSGTEYSVILDLEFTKDNQTGETAITGYSHTPIYTVTQDGVPVRVVRIKEAMAAYEANYIERVSEASYNAMAYALERIDARIKGE